MRHPRGGSTRVDEIGDERQEVEPPTMAGDFAGRIADSELLAIGQAGEDGARRRRQRKALIQRACRADIGRASTASATNTSISVKPADVSRDWSLVNGDNLHSSREPIHSHLITDALARQRN